MVESERNGRKVQIPEKVGLKAVTREGFDYEMTVTFDLSINHYATCTKDRTKGEDGLALFQDKSPRILNEEVGTTLRKWSEEGKADVAALKREVVTELNRLGLYLPAEPNDKVAFIRDCIQKITGLNPLQDENYESIVSILKNTSPEDAHAIMFPKPPEPPQAPPSPPEPPMPPQTPTEPEKPPVADPTPSEPPASEGSGKMDEAAFNRVFGEKVEEVQEQKIVTMDAWIADANKCQTREEAKALLDYMEGIKERAVHIHMVRSILTSRGLIPQPATV
jgi:hypothetical protein